MNFDDYYRGNVSWLETSTVFLTVHGSRAYGLATPASDLDVKGIAVPPARYFLGFLDRFEQAVGNDPVDLVIYGLHKFFKLAADANPNILEVLYTDPQHHLRCTGVGLKLIQHRDAFLSRKAKHTFSGYAMSQLKRIKTHRRWLLNPPVRPPTREEFDLPEHTLIPRDQLNAVQSMIRGKLDNWEGLDLAGLDQADRVQVLGRVEGLLAEMKISTKEKFMAAGRTLGIESNFLEAVEREKRYRGARNNWKSYQEWKEKRNAKRAALEAEHGYDCYLDDTEFLTEQGWKLYDKIGDRERLGTFKQGSEQVEYQHFSDRISKEFTGELGELHSRNSNCAVTLNHRMLVSPAHRQASNNFSTSYTEGQAEWSISPLHELVDGRKSWFHVRMTAGSVETDYPVDDKYLTLVGAYVSEGCIGKRLKDGTASVVRLSQIKGGRLEAYLQMIVEKYPGKCRQFSYERNEAWRQKSCTEVTTTLADRKIASQLEKECGCGELFKKLPGWTRSLSTEQVHYLLKVLVAGDGTERKHSRIYYTSSKQLADDIQTMCLSVGIVTQIWGPYNHGKRKRPMYQVYIADGTSNTTAVDLRRQGSQAFRINKVHGGRVVCFTVPNETLITRRGGKVAIQGNSKHAMHLVRLMRMCEEILKGKGVRVHREDREELLGIRRGAWSYDRLIEWAESMDAYLEGLYQVSTLPKAPDRQKLDELCQEITEEAVA